jgi:hypothetical protein
LPSPVGDQRRGPAFALAIGILVLSVTIVVLVYPLSAPFVMPALAGGGGPGGTREGTLLVKAVLNSTFSVSGLSGLSFQVSSASPLRSYVFLTNLSGMIEARIPVGLYAIATSDPRFFASASISIAEGNVSVFSIVVTESDSPVTMFDALDRDSSGFLDPTESLFVMLDSSGVPAGLSGAVSLVYTHDVTVTVSTAGSSSSYLLPTTQAVVANVEGEAFSSGSLVLMLSPVSDLPLLGAASMTVVSYSLSYEVSYHGD